MVGGSGKAVVGCWCDGGYRETRARTNVTEILSMNRCTIADTQKLIYVHNT